MMRDNRNKIMHYPPGFTLLEIAIVLLIIGLLTGGILYGLELNSKSELRRVHQDATHYTDMVTLFSTKYNALPGDMLNATMLWGKDASNCNSDAQPAGTPGTCNGDGDVRIEEPAGFADGQEEVWRLWQHLNLAGIYEHAMTGLAGSAGKTHAGPDVNIPTGVIARNARSGYYLFSPTTMANFHTAHRRNRKHLMLFGGENKTAPAGSPPDTPILTAEKAEYIDRTFDDGRPGSGFIMTVAGTSANADCTDDASSPGDETNESEDAVYALNDNGLHVCTLYFMLDF